MLIDTTPLVRTTSQQAGDEASGELSGAATSAATSVLIAGSTGFSNPTITTGTDTTIPVLSHWVCLSDPNSAVIPPAVPANLPVAAGADPHPHTGAKVIGANFDPFWPMVGFKEYPPIDDPPGWYEWDALNGRIRFPNHNSEMTVRLTLPSIEVDIVDEDVKHVVQESDDGGATWADVGFLADQTHSKLSAPQAKEYPVPIPISQVAGRWYRVILWRTAGLPAMSMSAVRPTLRYDLQITGVVA